MAWHHGLQALERHGYRMAGNEKFIPYPLGAHREADGIRFSFASKEDSCGVILYDRKTGKQQKKIAFLPKERRGNIYCKHMENIAADNVAYQFYEGDSIVADPYAKGFLGKAVYGKERKPDELKAVFGNQDFDWQKDEKPCIPYSDCICYCLHVRGFTKHASSGVADRGTFAGLIEKIPYLKESGITTVELQPVYEFLELPGQKEPEEPAYKSMEEPKLNYWGYTRGYYYAPKASYAAGVDAGTEFKELIRAFHKNGMEAVLQFYFPPEVKRGEIVEILRFWALEYHVDGFHLMGENLPVTILAQDALLADTKLWYYQFDTDSLYEKDELPAYCNLAAYQDDYLYAMRRYLKGDEDMLNTVRYQMRSIPQKTGRIHYFSNYYGMTMADMVSYDRKHNEANGEDNRDGNDYNCSWNCGEEGATRKKKVRGLRMKQLKNALCMLFFTQSTPLIFMGDEFGNSQKGNNNPYCQDNETTWLNWKDLDKNKELYEFFRMLVQLRKEHPILHMEREPRVMDYISCGYPDLSYHGESAWRSQVESYHRHMGIMYCGKYVKINRGREDSFFYLGMNMHWEPHTLALPKLPKGMSWQRLFSTADFTEEKDSDKVKEGEPVCTIAARSITVFISERS